MGLGLEMAQTPGLTHLSWETRVALGSPKDRWMQRETSWVRVPRGAAQTSLPIV